MGASTVLLVLLCAGGGVGVLVAKKIDPQTLKPVVWLRWEACHGTGPMARNACRELVRRWNAGSIGGAELAPLVDDLLDWQGDRQRAWLLERGDVLLAAQAANAMDEAHWRRFLRQTPVLQAGCVRGFRLGQDILINSAAEFRAGTGTLAKGAWLTFKLDIEYGFCEDPQAADPKRYRQSLATSPLGRSVPVYLKQTLHPFEMAPDRKFEIFLRQTVTLNSGSVTEQIDDTQKFEVLGVEDGKDVVKRVDRGLDAERIVAGMSVQRLGVQARGVEVSWLDFQLKCSAPVDVAYLVVLDYGGMQFDLGQFSVRAGKSEFFLTTGNVKCPAYKIPFTLFLIPSADAARGTIGMEQYADVAIRIDVDTRAIQPTWKLSVVPRKD